MVFGVTGMLLGFSLQSGDMTPPRNLAEWMTQLAPSFFLCFGIASFVTGLTLYYRRKRKR